MKRGYLPLVLAVAAVAALVLSGIGARAGWWHFRTGFVILKWSAYLAALTVVITIVFLIVPKLRAGAVVPLLMALVVSAATVYVPWSWKQKATSVPAIHDITTDTGRPPQFVAILPLRSDAPNSAEYEGAAIAEQQTKAYPDIQPVLLSEPPAQTFARALNAAEQMKWEIVAADSAARRIEATATTQWFGFKDDVVIRIEPNGAGSRVDIRSVSRVGKSDVGTNAARIREYVRHLN